MTTIQTKTIHFTIVDNPNVNRIQDQQGTLFVKATISFEESDAYDSSCYGYYDMQWLPLFSKAEPYTIPDAVRSKILAVLSCSYYNESEAFILNEGFVYDLSEIETRTISSIIK